MVLCKNFFLIHMHLQDIFFQNHPPTPSEVEWSAPKGFCGCGPKLDKDLTAVEEIRLVIFTMFSHRKVQTVSVFIISGFVYCSIFVY